MLMLMDLILEHYLLTFFNNKPFNKLIEYGHVYLAQPPLFKINKGSKEYILKMKKN